MTREQALIKVKTLMAAHQISIAEVMGLFQAAKKEPVKFICLGLDTKHKFKTIETGESICRRCGWLDTDSLRRESS